MGGLLLLLLLVLYGEVLRGRLNNLWLAWLSVQLLSGTDIPRSGFAKGDETDFDVWVHLHESIVNFAFRTL